MPAAQDTVPGRSPQGADRHEGFPALQGLPAARHAVGARQVLGAGDYPPARHRGSGVRARAARALSQDLSPTGISVRFFLRESSDWTDSVSGDGSRTSSASRRNLRRRTRPRWRSAARSFSSNVSATICRSCSQQGTRTRSKSGPRSGRGQAPGRAACHGYPSHHRAEAVAVRVVEQGRRPRRHRHLLPHGRWRDGRRWNLESEGRRQGADRAADGNHRRTKGSTK